jgi:hypothetical protein
MERRAFLATLGAVGIAPLLTAEPIGAETVALRRGLMCSAFDWNGIQQCEAGIDSYLLDVVSRRQNLDQWCWAACIEAVFTYHGHPVDQSRIVEAVFGEEVNMPGTPGQILSALNRRWEDDDGGEFRAHASSIGTNYVNAAQDLAADYPLIIGTMGHAMVLTSLTYARDVYGRGEIMMAEVRDPWPYNENHRALSPQEWYGISFAARIRVTSY